MNQTYKDLICVVNCALPFVVSALLAALIWWAWHRWTLRGFKSVIAMDGSDCLVAENGDIFIKRHTVRLWVYLTVLTLFGGARLFVMVMTLNSKGTIVLPFGLSVVVFMVFYAIKSLLDSLKLPAIRLITQENQMELRTHNSVHQLPFSDFQYIEASTPIGLGRGLFIFSIKGILQNGRAIEFGSVSGEIKCATRRAQSITQQIAQTLGVSVHPAGSETLSVFETRREND